MLRRKVWSRKRLSLPACKKKPKSSKRAEREFIKRSALQFLQKLGRQKNSAFHWWEKTGRRHAGQFFFGPASYRSTPFESLNKRILVYGFGPYGPFSDNITARILKTLPRQPGLTKRVFPVRFHRQQFIDALMRAKPDIVLGLGQSSRRRIEIESRGVNHRRANRSAKRRAIFATGPKQLSTTFGTKAGAG